MADIDCNKEMTGFHCTEVTLSKDDQSKMRTRRDAGRTRLLSGLDQQGWSHPKEQASQGSYAMRTMVQDDDCEYDIDDGAYFDEDNLIDKDGKALTPLAARERMCEALKWDGRLKHDAEVKRKCVRQIYPEGYHLDVPVYRIVVMMNDDGERVEYFELASENEWVRSDARAVTRWFNGKVGDLNAGESDGSQMRRVTKLTKKLARSRKEWKAETTSGITVTKLVTDHFSASEDRDDKALRDTWKAIHEALDKSTEVNHPVLDTMLAEAGDAQVQFFCTCLADALKILEDLDEGDYTRQKARVTWDEVFDTTYFSDQPNNDDQSGGKGSDGCKSAAMVVTSTETARRNDGGGRFG